MNYDLSIINPAYSYRQQRKLEEAIESVVEIGLKGKRRDSS